LGAGEPLPLDELAEQYGTSVVPVREALRVLQSEGLVALRPHRTAQVAEISTAEQDDLYRILAVLQPEAIRWAHGHLSGEDFVELRQMIALIERSAKARDLHTAFSMHVDFYLRIVRATGSRLLFSVVERLFNEAWRYRYVGQDSHVLKAWVSDLRRIVD